MTVREKSLERVRGREREGEGERALSLEREKEKERENGYKHDLTLLFHPLKNTLIDSNRQE